VLQRREDIESSMERKQAEAEMVDFAAIIDLQAM
jgi:hypothetical protein